MCSVYFRAVFPSYLNDRGDEELLPSFLDCSLTLLTSYSTLFFEQDIQPSNTVNPVKPNQIHRSKRTSSNQKCMIWGSIDTWLQKRPANKLQAQSGKSSSYADYVFESTRIYDVISYSIVNVNPAIVWWSGGRYVMWFCFLCFQPMALPLTAFPSTRHSAMELLYGDLRKMQECYHNWSGYMIMLFLFQY
jgi:hypothetical protein